MGESLMQRRRVRDEGLRVVNRFQQGRGESDGTCRRSELFTTVNYPVSNSIYFLHFLYSSYTATMRSRSAWTTE